MSSQHSALRTKKAFAQANSIIDIEQPCHIYVPYKTSDVGARVIQNAGPFVVLLEKERPMRILIFCTVLGLLGVNMTMAETYNGYELPPYTVVEQQGAVEIREYAPYLVAQVEVEGARRSAISKGFRMLARYIFGGNEGGEKIAMTVPVAQVPDGPSWAIRFMMPSAASEKGLPRPNDARVEMVEVPGGMEGIIVFSGMTPPGVLKSQEAKLRAVLSDMGHTATGPARYYFYNDPFTLPWKRRNEIGLPLAPTSDP